MIEQSMLITGIDIPFPSGQLTIHQPSYKEISYIGEGAFFTGVQFLTFSKKLLTEKDKSNLENLSDFDILMSILNDKSIEFRKYKSYIFLILTLLFPKYEMSIAEKALLFREIENNDKQGFIGKQNFEEFKNIIQQIFCLSILSPDAEEFKPTGRLSKKIAEKIQEGRDKIAKNKDNKDSSIFGFQVSILSVGLHIDINTLCNYTVYQLQLQFKRFELQYMYDMYQRARLAGASGMEDPEDWWQDIKI